MFEAADWCDACSRDTPFEEKIHVSRAGFAEMAGKLSSDTLFWTEKSVSRQVRVTVRKMIGFTDGSVSGYGFVRKMAVLRMGAFQDGSDGDER